MVELWSCGIVIVGWSGEVWHCGSVLLTALEFRGSDYRKELGKIGSW